MDEPPPLEDCSAFLGKLHSHNDFADCASTHKANAPRKEDKSSLVDIGEDKSCVASILSPPTLDTSRPSAKSKPLKRGFFSQSKEKSLVPKEKEVPFISAKKPGKKVPDFMHLSPEDHPQEQLRKEIQEMLKPTEEIVGDVMKDSEIKANLEDPEIMLAVQDIASNPEHINKYRHNPKIAAFYNRMGKMLGCAYG